MFPRAPFVGIALLYLAGIIAGDWLLSLVSISSEAIILIAFLLFASCILAYLIRKKVLFGFCFSALLVCLGTYGKIAVEERNNAEIQQFDQQYHTHYQATVSNLPEKRKSTYRVEVDINRTRLARGKWKNVTARTLINIDADIQDIPKPGQQIIVKGNLDLPMEATNPEQFDYRRYLKNKGILWVDYLRKGDFQTVSLQPSNYNLTLWSLKISEWADQEFRRQIVNDQSYGLVKAMFLGRRDDLGAEQINHYVASGTVHILSVSGMHVAIIFLIISHVLSWMKRFRFGNLFYLCTIILLLGFYALITGLAPSVQRATIMCIIFVVAEVFGKKNNAMNTLAFSALLILLSDPSVVYDVGFQLSYLAMSGIFLFYKPILSILSPSNRVSKFVWQITALSFAAQLATFPLSLYYFHQFPSYFWLINPFVIAFTNILLPASMIMLAVSTLNITWLQWLINSVVDWSARLTDLSATIPGRLPGYLVENLHLGLIEILLLYFLMLASWLAYERREYVYLKCSFVIAFLFASFSVSQSVHIYMTPSIVVHNVPKHSVYSFKRDNVVYVACDNGFPMDKQAYDFYLKNYLISQEAGEIKFITAEDKL
ncbi:ComEC/Rec2 family competence protein [Dyadobacter arcticus]|uniref:Competence protein ComEC n=1 Tax=Dyadobacter arcticus TaxID=1078754 RepID=A0ABX0UR77_9BACT|nr:ComEC/Rec2 family competence protein [Dyadobacter arcticus]NIJ54110.1 competence protein ComEC [Dyadobacter arcticus]